jgi:hypothetical protein
LDRIHSKDIRLVQILPGGAGDAINLSICTVTLKSSPVYISLSYTWGDPQQTCPIICEGKDLHVTRNLQDALWQLRQSHLELAERFPIRRSGLTRVFFWIDAICINQSDVDEKTDQVKLMWEIYSHAELVIAWLGKQDEASKRGVELIRHMSSVVGSSASEVDAERSDEQIRRKIRISDFNTLGLTGLISPAWNDLFSILTRDWFSRVWIIQEIVAARRCIFLCGDEVIDSSILLGIGKILEENKILSSIRDFDRNRVLAVNANCLAHLRLKKEHDFNTLLWSTHQFKASDQRDRIFALTRLKSGPQSNSVFDLINYRLSTHQVLIEYASTMLAQGSLDVLCYAQALGNIYSLPSWVPHWTAPDYCYTPLTRIWDASAQTQIAPTSSQYYQIEPSDVSALLINWGA